MKRVMFYCQHLLGMGHLIRSTEIVRAMSRDFKVLFVVGGEIPEGYRFPENIDVLELIPLKSSPDFSDLLLCDFSWDIYETKAMRCNRLLRAFDEFQPDVLVTELFPFGRKQFSFELLPLLARAHGRNGKTMIVASLRDILVRRKDQQEYEERVCKLVNTYYDLILVHGDERLQTLEETFSRVADLECQLAYTGYVVPKRKDAASREAVRPEQNRKPTIIVSNGSGMCPSGHRLLKSVLQTASVVEKQLPHDFHIFAGPLMPENVYKAFQQTAEQSPNVMLSRYTPDLSTLLRQADLSISMAGYNTVMDVLSTGVRALVYPVTGNGDDEQYVRATKLGDKGVLRVVGENQLQPETLAQEIRSALGWKPYRLPFNDAGAQTSSILLKRFLEMRSNVLSESTGVPKIGALCALASAY